MMQRALCGVVLATLLLAAGCERIHEPWIRDDNQLLQERSRSSQAQETLRHRLFLVQTDR